MPVTKKIAPPDAPFRARDAEWGLNVDLNNARTLEDMEAIPGLRVVPSMGQVFGLADAVAAAAFRLKRKLPTTYEQGQPLAVMPSGLRHYQADGVRQMMGIMQNVGGCLLADDMGLGKTRQAITLAQCCLPADARIFVACPAFARETWRDELTKWGATGVAVLEPVRNKAVQAAWDNSPKARWVISSFELSAKALTTAFANGAPDLLLIDEAHMLRGRTAGRSKVLEQVAAQCNWKLAMTATPAWSRPRDFYRLLHVLFGRRFGSPSAFDFAYCDGRINEWGGMDNKGCSRADELKQRLTYYMVRRTKEEVLGELPPITRQVIWCDATKEGTSAFHHAMMRRRDGSHIADALRATLEGKVETALQLAANAKKFVLFTYLREHARTMARRLAVEFETPCVCITGDDGARDRAAAIRLAQERGWGVVATIDSAGAALNMQGVASIGIMHAIDWVPLKMAQAEARIHRMGQTQPVQWLYLAMRDSMDERVVGTVVEKLDQWQAVMGKAGTGELHRDLESIIGTGSDAAKEMLRAVYDAMPDYDDEDSEDT